MRRGIIVAVAGVGIGLGAALVVSPLMASLLFETSPRDAHVFTAVAIALTATAVLATSIPAFRARHVNPLDAMRTE